MMSPRWHILERKQRASNLSMFGKTIDWERLAIYAMFSSNCAELVLQLVSAFIYSAAIRLVVGVTAMSLLETESRCSIP